MSAIQKLISAKTTFPNKLVRQAMREASNDSTKMAQLKSVCDTAEPHQFQNQQMYDQFVGFVITYYKDVFVIKNNSDDPAPRKPTIDEARITKVTDVTREVVRRPPNTISPGRFRDPLNLTGSAEAGAKVKFYNASEPGRPDLGETTVDAHGRWKFELTDETKFKFGDQVGVLVEDSGGQSKPVVVPTEPFQVTNTTTNFYNNRGGPIVDTQISVLHQELDKNHDTRNPFYQDALVTKEFGAPRETGEPYSLKLIGGDDAVEPNSTVTVNHAGQTFTTKADDLGKFALKVTGFSPGDRLKVEVKDINNMGIDIDYIAPRVEFNLERLTDGVKSAPSETKPRARETHGDGAPWIKFSASKATIPFGAVIVRNKSTGDLFELNADKDGKIDAAIGGIESFDVLEMTARDVNGNLHGKSFEAVIVPEKIVRGSQFLVPTEKLNRTQPDITSVIESIKGPPKDLEINGQISKAGPYLAMPDIGGLPPFGQLAVMREGKMIQTLRADNAGNLKDEFLRGVHAGDQLNFRVLDAAGREFPTELQGWKVPKRGTSKVLENHIHTTHRPLSDCLDKVGFGVLDLDRSWLKPFKSAAGEARADTNNIALNYKREFFGDADVERSEFAFESFPQALAKELGLPKYSDHLLEVAERMGSKTITFTGNGNARFQIGIDDTLGVFNAGDPNRPLTLPGHLPEMTELLKGALAMTAVAYDAGKESGDPEYDRAMGAAKSVLFAMDQLAVQNPEHKDAIVDAAKAAFPDKGFLFEATPKNQVPLVEQRAELAKTSAPRSGAISLLDARTALMGSIKGGEVVGTADVDANEAPTVESAIIVMRENKANNRPTTHQALGRPLFVKGHGKPGDVVQIYNVSTPQKTLLSESVIGPDGKFDLNSSTKYIALNDQLGIMSITPEGKKSSMRVVPTDGYVSKTHEIRDARPVSLDSRPPFFRIGEAKVKRVDVDQVREGGPWWSLSGGDLTTEPHAKIEVITSDDNGNRQSFEASADGEGRFEMEFASASRRQFTINVRDAGGQKTAVKMNTPSLAQGIQSADVLSDQAHGIVQIMTPEGPVRATVVQMKPRSRIELSADDRNNDAVDLVFSRQYYWSNSEGRSDNINYIFHVRLAPGDAEKFKLHPGEEFDVELGELNTIPIEGQANVQMSAGGRSRVLERDFAPKLG